MRLVCQILGVVEDKVLNEFAPFVRDGFVQTVVGPCLKPRFDGVNQGVTVSFVLLVEEAARFVAKLASLAFEQQSKDESRFKQRLRCCVKIRYSLAENRTTDLPHECVNFAPPSTELLVFLCVVPQSLSSDDHTIHPLAVRASLEESTHLRRRLIQVRVGKQRTRLIGARGCDAPSVAKVRLKLREEPRERLLVRRMRLTFNDDFLEAVNDLVAPLWRELLLQILLCVVQLSLSSVLVLVWNASR